MKIKNKVIILFFVSFISMMLISNVSAVDFLGGNFNDLDNSIQSNNNGELVLNSDIYPSTYDVAKYKQGINISNTITIDGKNHTISSTNTNIFNVVDGGHLTLKNVNIVGVGKTGIRNVAICVDSSSRVYLFNVTFRDNVGVYGASIYNSGTVVMENCAFISNYASVGGSAVFQHGDNPLLIVKKCSFVKNYGDVLKVYTGSATVSDSEFFENQGIEASAIFSSTSDISIYNNLFVKNLGNAIGVVLGPVIVERNIFMSNNVAIRDLEAYGTFQYNVFIGNAKSISSNGGYVNNNYLGSNDPVGDNLISGTTSRNTVLLEVSGESGVDFNSLDIVNPTFVTVGYVGSNLDKLPEFKAYASVTAERSLVLNNNQVTIGRNPVKIDILPIKYSSGSIVLYSEFNNQLCDLSYKVNYIPLNEYNFDVDMAQNIRYGDSLLATVDISDENNNPVSGIVYFNIADKTYELHLDNGHGTISIDDLNIGSHELNIEYLTSNYYYDDVNQTRTINVEKGVISPVINANNIKKGEVAHIAVDLLKNVVGEIRITIASENKVAKVTIVDGKASADFAGLSVGNKKVRVYFAGNGNYEKFDVTATFKVTASSDGGTVVVVPPVEPPHEEDDYDEIPTGFDESAGGGEGSSTGSNGPNIVIIPGNEGNNQGDDSGDIPLEPGEIVIPGGGAIEDDKPANPNEDVDNPGGGAIEDDKPAKPNDNDESQDVPSVPPVNPEDNGEENNYNGSGISPEAPESLQDSDAINSADSNAQSEAARVGTTELNVNSDAGSTQSSNVAESESKAYELNKTAKDVKVSKNIQKISYVVLVMIMLILFAIGYRRKQNSWNK